MMGSDRVLAAVGMDGTFPRALGVISDRFGTPVRVNLMSGLVATVFSIVAINLASGSAATTFEIVLTIAISTVLLSYLIIYPSAVRLRRLYPDVHRPFVVPGRQAPACGPAPSSPPASSPSARGSRSSRARSRACSASTTTSRTRGA